jgi:ATP/maltotriose-dependent transcriptional regulator MalT
MQGAFDAARALYRRGRALVRELGQGVNAASTAIDVLAVELLAGDLAAAEREVRPDYEFLVRIGETYTLSTIAALLARVVRDQGRDEEALALTRVAEQASDPDDLESHAFWRSIRAPILARAGDLHGAEALAREGVALSRRSEAPLLQADALCELATVLAQSGRDAEALDALDQAVALFEAKGDVVSAARWRGWGAQCRAALQ